MLQIPAQFADGWSQWGGYEVETEADFYKVTAERCARFDELAANYHRLATMDLHVGLAHTRWRGQRKIHGHPDHLSRGPVHRGRHS